MSYTLKLPPVTYAGKGSLSMLGKLVADEKAKEVLLCTDQGVRRTGLLEQVEQTLRQNPDLRIQILDTLVPEPSYQAVEENLRAICRTPDLIIALGGGSVMQQLRRRWTCPSLCTTCPPGRGITWPRRRWRVWLTFPISWGSRTAPAIGRI